MSPNNHIENNENRGIFDRAREFVHEKVKTQEQREAEKSFTEKLKDKIPESAEDAGDRMGKTIDNAVQSVKDGFQERLNEDSQGNKIRDTKEQKDSPGLLQGVTSAAGSGVKATREYIYDVTKSQEEKESDRWESMTLTEKIMDKLPSTQLESAGKNADQKLDDGFSKVKESLPRETNTLENAGTKIDDGFQHVKESLPNKVERLFKGDSEKN